MNTVQTGGNLKVNPFKVEKDILIEAPLENEELLLSLPIENVDRVGFDLTTLEQEYYKANGLTLRHQELYSKDSQKGSWDTIFDRWFLESKIQEHFYIDHSGLYGVYPFAGRAKEQLRKFIPRRPELAKLYNLKGKVGYDVCIDYINQEKVIEVVHIEHDYGLEDYKFFLENKQKLETRLQNTNFTDLAHRAIYNQRDHDYKASLLGFPKAFTYYNRL